MRNMEKKTAEYLLIGSIPGISDVGGDWVILGLARGNRLSSSFRKGYYENVVKTLRVTGSEKLHRSKSTENSRVILALTSLGYYALVAYIRYLDGVTALFDMKKFSFETGPDTTGKDSQGRGIRKFLRREKPVLHCLLCICSCFQGERNMRFSPEKGKET